MKSGVSCSYYKHILFADIVLEHGRYLKEYFEDKEYGTAIEKIYFFYIYIPDELKSFKTGLQNTPKKKLLMWTDRFVFSEIAEKNSENFYRYLILNSMREMLIELEKKKVIDFNKVAFKMDILQVMIELESRNLNS